MSCIVFKNGETWLICGGRDFSNQEMFDEVMSDLMDIWGCPEKVVHGAASGADTMADAWAKRMALDVIAVPAEWDRHGLSAGPIRNGLMLDHNPKRVIAFPGGRGTADMVARAYKRKHEIDVVQIKPHGVA